MHRTAHNERRQREQQEAVLGGWDPHPEQTPGSLSGMPSRASPLWERSRTTTPSGHNFRPPPASSQPNCNRTPLADDSPDAMLTNLKLELSFPVAVLTAGALIIYFSFLKGPNDGRLLHVAKAAFTIPGILPYGEFRFLEFNRTFDDPEALGKQNQATAGDTKVFVVYNGVLASGANINWGNRLQVQIVEAGSCSSAKLIHTVADKGSDYPLCNDETFLYNRNAFSPTVCPQGELTCTHAWCGCVWESWDDACAW
jgi:hypothetical protein